MKSGYEILISPHGMHRQFFDFYASKGSQKVAVEVKSVRSRHFVPMLRNTIQRQLAHVLQGPEAESFTKLHLVCVLREEDIDYPVSRIYAYLMRMSDELTEKMEIFIGKLNEENSYVPLEQ